MKKLPIIVTISILFTQMALGRILHVGKDSQFPSGQSEVISDLQMALDIASDGDTVLIQAGEYSATPAPFIESLCGNSIEHRTKVQASRGFIIESKSVHIVGAGTDEAVLITNAGYGVLFLHSRGSSIEKLTITSGKRDADGNATDAAIVAKYSTVTIQNVCIRDNIDRIDTVVVGIGGIISREDSELYISHNQIINNGWDGIALYRGATAVITDNTIRQGRGAGIGITWDAKAIVLRNRISEYWKGIGTFGASRAVVSNNLVKDCLGWGIIATGNSYLDAVNNNVIHNGNCGLAIWSDECRGRFLNNIVIQNGWREFWVAPRVGLWAESDPANFQIAHNNIWDNVEGNYQGLEDLTGWDGNISANPMFISEDDYHLQEISPCINAGSPEISEGDGSRSDMGMYGGPGGR